MTTNKKTTIVIFTIITAFSSFVMATWLIRVFASFNRTPDLMETVFLFIVGIPTLLMILVFAITIAASIVYSIMLIASKTKNSFSVSAIITLSILLIVGGGMATFGLLNPNGIIARNTREWYFNDSMRPTSDGLFEYRVELVFPFQRNARLRLLVRDRSTGEEFHIPLDAPASEIGGVVAATETEFQRRIIWAKMTPSRETGEYLLMMPARRAFNEWETGHGWVRIDGLVYNFHNLHAIGNATFLIDIPNRTATRID